MGEQEREHQADQGGLSGVLAANPYPGRGILCARYADGAVVAGYFVTGRSDASREREIRTTDTAELAVAARARQVSIRCAITSPRRHRLTGW